MKTALITGASRRLGLYTVNELLKEGWNVLALTRESSLELDGLKSSRLEIYQVDYTDIEALLTFVASIKQMYKSLNLLVHNASRIEKDVNMKKDMWSQYEELFFIHMQLPAILNENLYPLLLNAEKNHACIINITDIYADNPNGEHVFYCSTKAGLENMTRSYAKKYAPKIRVNSIQPGPIAYLPTHTQLEKDKVNNQTLLKTESGFLPVYQAIKFIVDNQFMTGATIKVDGGRSIGKT